MNEDDYSYSRCDLCGRDDTAFLFSKDEFKIVRCKNCHLVYVNPRLRMERLTELYNENIISPFDYYLETLADDERTFRERLDIIEKYTKAGKLLDVGCSIGTFAKLARDRGWEVYGVDINRTSAEYCKKKLGLDVKVGNFHELDLPRDFFDVVLMNDFLEHTESPTQALSKANSLLKKGGYVFIVTPKFDSAVARMSGARWLHLKPDEHLFYFSSSSLTKLLKKTGFEVKYISHIGRYRNLRTLVVKSATYGRVLSRFLRGLFDNDFGKRLSIKLDPRDEMAVIARKV